MVEWLRRSLSLVHYLEIPLLSYLVLILYLGQVLGVVAAVAVASNAPIAAVL